jgi:cryptochrome
VPELKSLDEKFIYEPWKAPITEQKKAGVRIRGDRMEDLEGIYPKPTLRFAKKRMICLDGMKEAYRGGLYGIDPKVINGIWRELFNNSAEEPREEKSFEDAMGSGADDHEKVPDGPKDGDEYDGAEEEDGSGAKEEGGENRGGDKKGKVAKRKMGQGTLYAHVKKS